MLAFVLTMCALVKLAIGRLLTEKLRSICNKNNLVWTVGEKFCSHRYLMLSKNDLPLHGLKANVIEYEVLNEDNLYLMTDVKVLRLDANRNRQTRTRLLSSRRSFARNIANASRTERRRVLRIAVNFSDKLLK